MDRRAHWEKVYRAADLTAVSWYEPEPARSLRYIEQADLPEGASVLDVGGGTSTLVDCLLAAGYRVSVLDVSGVALAEARRRLGPDAARVEWLETDVTRFRPTRRWDLWHDRAALHFLTDSSAQQAYRRALLAAVAADGQAVIATFGPQGPKRCSGLEVQRYSAESLSALLDPEMELCEDSLEEHRTPGGVVQQFLYCRFRRAVEEGA